MTNNIMVTGGDGFLGKRLMNCLKKLDINSYSFDITNGGDIVNLDSVENFVKTHQINTIVHLAAIADLNIFRDKPELGYQINVIGTRNIIDVCNRHNLRLLFASTCCCYGNNHCHPSDETSPLCPSEPYAQSKKTSEEDIVATAKVPYTILRLATFYGPEMRPALANYKIMDEIYHQRPVLIHGDGHQTRTYTHVDDIVGCIVTVLTNPHKYTVVNCTNNETVSVLDIVKTCEEMTGKRADLVFGEDRVGQIYHEEILSDRVKDLGYKFKFNWKDGMLDTYKWYLTTQ